MTQDSSSGRSFGWPGAATVKIVSWVQVAHEMQQSGSEVELTCIRPWAPSSVSRCN